MVLPTMGSVYSVTHSSRGREGSLGHTHLLSGNLSGWPLPTTEVRVEEALPLAKSPLQAPTSNGKYALTRNSRDPRWKGPTSQTVGYNTDMCVEGTTHSEALELMSILDTLACFLGIHMLQWGCPVPTVYPHRTLPRQPSPVSSAQVPACLCTETKAPRVVRLCLWAAPWGPDSGYPLLIRQPSQQPGDTVCYRVGYEGHSHPLMSLL